MLSFDMGCDIHLYVEYRKKNSNRNWESSGTVMPNCGDRIYGMFAVMANVRNYDNLEQIVPDRGYPMDATYSTDNAYFCEISEDELHEDSFYHASVVTKKVGKRTLYMREDIDYHSANWCTASELEECINFIFKDESGNWSESSIEWLALLGAMKGYEMSGEFECRAVYWFDS